MKRYRAEQREHKEQVALFEWADLMVRTGSHPELALLYAIPNGGRRDIQTAQRLKREGVRPGVLDVCLPVPRGSYAALYIEMKRPEDLVRPAGVVSKEQKWWLTHLADAGNLACVCYGWTEARDVIVGYLAIVTVSWPIPVIERFTFIESELK